MLIHSKTDIGKKRSVNQDFYGLQSFSDYIFAVLCDGMGGTNGGFLASHTAVDNIMAQIKEKITLELDLKDTKSVLRNIIRDINTHIHGIASKNPEYEGMGTTCVMSLIKGHKAIVINVGDSRCYLIRDGEITRLTKDHSMVAHMVEVGELTEDEARVHPSKNIITMAIGPDKEVYPDAYEIDLKSKDILIMCSDGLTNMLSDKKIKEITLLSKHSLICDNLIDAANDVGGYDNITAIVRCVE